jgi:hypothetical protein
MLTAQQIQDIRNLPYAYQRIVTFGMSAWNSVHLRELTEEQAVELRGLGFAVFRLKADDIVVRWPC